jgi:hypothetical protein
MGDLVDESALEHLVVCYFHEDWDIEGPTVEGVIDTYLRDVQPEEVEEALSEIAILLDEPEDEVAQRLREWYLMYDYTVDGMDAHGWLRRVQAHLLRAAGA